MTAYVNHFIRMLVIINCIILSSSILTAGVISTADGQGGDTYLRYYNQGGSYGDEESLLISKDYVPYIQLDLSSIGTSMVTDANFVLFTNPGYSPFPSYNYSFAIFGLLDGSDDWDELTLKYNNAPVITNPITWNPLLTYLGRVHYSTSDPSETVTMEHTGGKPLIDFLNNRGPDNLVTFIIASDRVTAERFFSTKENYGDGSEAPFIEYTLDPMPTAFCSWTGSFDDNWHDPDNWENEFGFSDIPDSNSIVNIVGNTNLPITIQSDAQAAKLFIDSGGLHVADGTVHITDGVLRVADGVQVDITGGQISLGGDVEGHMWGLIGTNKIVTSSPCQKEVYAEVVDANLPNFSKMTWVRTRDIERRLSWGNSIADANGILGRAVDPFPPQARDAQYCVDRSGMIGAEAHVGSIGGGATVPGNYYYAYNMAYEEPHILFEFDDIYNLTEMLVWNYELGYALQKVKIEYSIDGISYTVLQDGSEEYFYFDYGNKLGTKNDIVNFGLVPAKYVKITAVGGPGIGNYEGSSYGRYILREVQFRHEGFKACEPNPVNHDSSVNTDLEMLSWIPGKNAITGQDVWFGTHPGSMTLIGDNIPPCQDSISIPGGITITSNTQYYWRVDAANGGGTETGQLWTFVTRPYISYNPGGEGVVYAFGIKTSGGSKGYLAANGSGMNGDLRNVLYDSTMWYCANPADVGISEPELYIEFDKIYDLNEMWVWNYPSGMGSSPMAWKTIEIRYSTDGVNYSTLTNGLDSTFVLPQGNPDGTHDTEISFGIPARYVRIKAVGGSGVGNYGSPSYRLCEVRFYADGAYSSANAFDPVPAVNSEVDIFTELSWKPGTSAVTGQDLWFGPAGSLEKIADNLATDVSSYMFERPLDNYTTYQWRVDSIDVESVAQGDVWSFATKARQRFNPVVIGIINAEGSPGNNGSEGYNAANWSGLNYDHHYSFEYSNGWYYRIKDLPSPDPDPDLKITFDREYELNEMWIWNHDGADNTAGDHEYNIAVKDIRVEYSVDDISYTTLGTYTLPHGDPEGQKDTVIDFGGAQAKYVKIIVLSNYGSTTWGYKLREVRFYYEVPLWSDLDVSKNVDFVDYSIIASDWLQDNWTGTEPVPCPGKPAGDVNGDCRVDEIDIQWLGLDWLEEIVP